MGSNPVQQHFVPACYLRNFQNEGGKKGKLTVSDLKGENRFQSGATRVCKEGHLYTLGTYAPGSNEGFELENLYSRDVEHHYPMLFEKLVDVKQHKISSEERTQLLEFVTSLHFRTPKFLRFFDGFLQEVLDLMIIHNPMDSDFIRFEWDGEVREFERDKEAEFRKEWYQENRQSWIISQLDWWRRLMETRVGGALQVLETTGEDTLITCDNPVHIRGTSAGYTSPFNLNATIELALDPSHLLLVHGKDVKADPNQIYRMKADSRFTLLINEEIRRNAERWLIGRGESIQQFFQLRAQSGWFDAL